MALLHCKSSKKIVSLDLQLYIKYIKSKSKNAVSSTLIGKLLKFFEALKVVGKNINSNCINTWLVKVGICGPGSKLKMTPYAVGNGSSCNYSSFIVQYP